MEGMGILTFDDGRPQRNGRRRKSLKACDRCRSIKKACNIISGHGNCNRCEHDRVGCSFNTGALSPAPKSIDDPSNEPQTVVDGIHNDITSGQQPLADVPRDHHVRNHDEINFSSPSSYGMLPTPQSLDQLPSSRNEARYSNMLELIQGRSSELGASKSSMQIKLIGDTNPLSALLQKSLKHKIVTSLCAFRSPDPPTDDQVLASRAAGGSGWDWKQAYARSGLDQIRMTYLSDLGCFELPGPDVCGSLLEIFFTRVHPILPVIDRSDFLARYYGVGNPPPLILLLSVFLSASRYSNNVKNASEGVRDICDRLHTRFRALAEVDILHDRFTMVQANLLSSLHWEGREGVNSALDSLSLAVRISQELGLHRRSESMDETDAKLTQLRRRTWWCAYALDRFNAAQEGTTLMINESDCDTEDLTEGDFDNEDEVTQTVTLLNVSLSRITEYSIRALYSLHSNTQSIDHQLRCRDELVEKLNNLSAAVAAQLSSSSKGDEIKTLWESLLQVHINSIRLLVYRPFLLYFEDFGGITQYRSRDIARAVALDIITRLNYLHGQELLRYAWPFTIYATVNAMLIFWYDLISPNGSSEPDALGSFVAIVNFLEVMGHTWWAAAAKHKLGEALLRLAGGLHHRLRTNEPQTVALQPVNPVLQDSMTYNPGSSGFGSGWVFDGTVPLLSYEDNLEFWSSIGLDFENDVAAGVYGII